MTTKIRTTACAIALLLAGLLLSSAALGKPPKGGGGGGGGGSPPPDPEIVYYDGGVWVMNADGSNQRWVAGGMGPGWSPDGTQIAYYGSDPVRGIYIVNVDGSDRRLLAATNLRGEVFRRVDWSPVPTPDGNHRIVYTDAPDGYDPQNIEYEIYLIKPDGTGRMNLQWPNADWIPPTWAPDGKRLLVRYGIFHLGVDDSGDLEVQQMTTLPRPMLGWGSAHWANHHDWIVAGVYGLNGTSPIMILDLMADDLQWQFVQGSDGAPLFGSSPSFSPDDSMLAFRSGDRMISRINLDGTGELVLVSGKGRSYPTAPCWKRPPLLMPEEELLMQLLLEEQGMLTPEEAAFLEFLRAEEDPTLDAHEE